MYTICIYIYIHVFTEAQRDKFYGPAQVLVHFADGSCIRLVIRLLAAYLLIMYSCIYYIFFVLLICVWAECTARQLQNQHHLSIPPLQSLLRHGQIYSL